MASKLDQSLDSIISSKTTNKRKTNQSTNGTQRKTNQSTNRSTNGPERRQRKRNDDTPYARPTPIGFSTPFENSTAAHLAAANFAAMQQQLQLQQQQLAALQKPAKQPKQPKQDKPAQPNVPVKKITGDTIHITNLAKDVTTDDVKEIFEKVGEIKNVSVNYNQAGQSLGTATVQFKKSVDAEKAMLDYDQAEVDGKPMYIKLVGVVSQAPVVVKKKKVEKPAKKEASINQPTMPSLAPTSFNAALMAPMTFPTMQMFAPPAFNAQQPTNRSQSTGSRRGQSNNQSNNQSTNRSTSQRGGRGGRGGRTVSAQPSMADLDAELDSYHK